MATQRRYSIEFKRQIVQDYQGGETLHGLAKRHGISRNLVRIWAAKAEAGEFDDDLAAASILQEYEARIGALERLVGKLALENEFLKGASRHVRQPTSGTTSVIAGPVVSRSPKDAG
jgi:transposase